MYRTYTKTKPENEQFVMSHWDGDCYSYTVCESQEEYDAEKERLAKIDEEYRQAKENYLKSLKED